jgi:hypothetical protein
MAIPLRQLIPLQQARLRRIEIGRYIKLNSSSAYIAVAILCALMGLALITQTVRVAQAGEEITALHKQRTKLEREQKDLKLRVARAQSIPYILDYVKASGMVPVSQIDVEYVVLEPSVLALPAERVPVAGEQRP